MRRHEAPWRATPRAIPARLLSLVCVLLAACVAEAPGAGGGDDRSTAGSVSGTEAAASALSALPVVTIWIAGDSTVANGSSPCPIGWGGQLAPYFDDQVTVVNSAVGGRSVRTWLYDVQSVMDGTGECVLTLDASGQPVLQARWQAMLDRMKAGDYLFIQFGINDASTTCNRHVGRDAFKASLGTMAQAAQQRGAHPVFVTPLSGIACTGSAAHGTRNGYAAATIEAGAQYAVPVVDLHARSVALYSSLGFCPLPGGVDVSASTTGPVGDFFCNDHTHLEKAGAVQIAGLVASALRDQGIGLAAYLRTAPSTSTHTLTIQTSGAGSTDPAAGAHVYEGGTAVTVTAIPASGAAFTGWSGAATGTANPAAITMSADQTLTASFSSGGGSSDRTGPITGLAGKCIDVASGSTANGAKVDLWDCDGTAKQSWTVASDGTLRALGKCMDITGRATANGTLVELWTCHGGANQQWQPYNGGLRNPDSGRCLDVPSRNSANGTQLVIWDCNGGSNQQWTLP